MTVNYAKHKNILLQILKDIYSDTSISPHLGFKGGTAANLFCGLDRDSFDLDFDLLDEFSKQYFLKYADTAQKEQEIKGSLSFYPLTAQIIAIALLEVESDRGVVYFQNGDNRKEKFKEGAISFIPCSEKEIIKYFWKSIKRYDQFVSFNGRQFDCPFIMLRSALHRIRATKNLVPYRYSHNIHIDLADQMTFYDAMRRRFGLHMWCKAFGLKSPKEDGVSGLEVSDLYKRGEYRKIARYCMGDAYATKELFFYWDRYLKFY